MNSIIFGDCQIELEKLEDNSVDCIITDPPYRYLEHKLDSDFDREKVFNELYRVLKNNSFICIFGRGAKLCEDVVCMEKQGFKFKEEVVWNKNQTTTPHLPIGRQHELCFILAKGKPTLNRVYIDYADYCIDNNQIKNLKRAYKEIQALINEKNIDKLKKYFKTGKIDYDKINKTRFAITTGMKYTRDRRLGSLLLNERGTLLRSIITVKREKGYTVPTQKPLELLRRLLLLTSKENDIILDPFCGSGSLGIACLETNRDFYLIEKDKEYYSIAKKNINEYTNKNLFCKKNNLTK